MVEVGLSLIQIIKWKKTIAPYQVTPILRPLIRLFSNNDLRPRQHSSNGPNWNYETDRMKPGRYSQENGWPDYTINSYGIRGDEFKIPKPKDIFRVLVLGSSSAFGAECQDTETYPEVLEEILSRHSTRRRVEVLNYGMSSKGLYYNARHYFEEVDRLAPDVVILNNVRNTWFYDQNQRVCNYFDIIFTNRRILAKLNIFLTDNSLGFRLLRRAVEGYLFKKWMGPGDRYNKYFFEEIYYQAIRSMALDVKGRGGAFVIILEPYYQDPARQLDYKKHSNEELFKVLNGESTMAPVGILPALIYNNIFRLQKEFPDVIVLDPVETFIKKENETPGKDYFIGHSHLTPKGSRLLAELITEKLLERISL